MQVASPDKYRAWKGKDMTERKLLDYALAGVKEALEICREWENKYPEDERIQEVKKTVLKDYEEIMMKYREV